MAQSTSRKGMSKMRLSAKVGQRTFGEGWAMREYEVKVQRTEKNVDIRFKNHDAKRMLRGGTLSVPTSVATQLAHALLLAATGSLDSEIVFTHRPPVTPKK